MKSVLISFLVCWWYRWNFKGVHLKGINVMYRAIAFRLHLTSDIPSKIMDIHGQRGCHLRFKCRRSYVLISVLVVYRDQVEIHLHRTVKLLSGLN